MGYTSNEMKLFNYIYVCTNNYRDIFCSTEFNTSIFLKKSIFSDNKIKHVLDGYMCIVDS